MKISVDIEKEVLELRFWEMYARAFVQYTVVYLLPRVDPSRDREISRLDEFINLKIPLLFQYTDVWIAVEAADEAKVRMEKKHEELIALSVERCRKIIRNPEWKPKKLPFSWNEFFWKSVENGDLVYPPADVAPAQTVA